MFLPHSLVQKHCNRIRLTVLSLIEKKKHKPAIIRLLIFILFTYFTGFRLGITAMQDN